MKTIRIDDAAMATRVARFRDLHPLQIQQNDRVPLAARDVVYARTLLPVIGLEGAAKTPVNSNAPIIGAGGITITYAVCPPGQGPSPAGLKVKARASPSGVGRAISCMLKSPEPIDFRANRRATRRPPNLHRCNR